MTFHPMRVFLTLRNLNVALCVSCLFITAIICTSIAISSGDTARTATQDAGSSALKRTRDSSDRALRNTRQAGVEARQRNSEVAKDNIVLRANAQLDQTAQRCIEGASGWFERVRRNVQSVIDYMNCFSKAQQSSWDHLWEQRRLLWAVMHSNFGMITGTGLTLNSGMNVLMVEADQTVHLPVNNDGNDDQTHFIRIMYNNGTFPGETFSTTAKYKDGGLIYPERDMWTENGPDVWESGNGRGNAQGTGGGSIASAQGWNPAEQMTHLLGSMLVPMVGRKLGWSPVIEIEVYVGVAISGTFEDSDGNPIGTMWAGMDLRGISTFLGSISLGSPFARVYMTSASDWVYDTLSAVGMAQSMGMKNSVNYMAGVSHGSAWKYKYHDTCELCSPKPEMQTDVDNPDDWVRGIAMWVHEFGGGYEGVQAEQERLGSVVSATRANQNPVTVAPLPEELQTFNDPLYADEPHMRNGLRMGSEYASTTEVPGLDLDEAAREEDYFIKVARLTDRWGMDLWITLAIDRESVLGEVERREQATQEWIAENDRQVMDAVEKDKQETTIAIAVTDMKVQEDLDADRATLYVIVIVVSVLLIAVCVVFASAIARPLKHLGEDMTKVGMMDLGHVDEGMKLSRLAEVKKMEKAFLRMVRNMKELQNYMPQSIQLATAAEDDDDEDVDCYSPRAGRGGNANVDMSNMSATMERPGGAGSMRTSKASRSQKYQQQMTVASSAASSQKSMVMKQFLKKATGEGTKRKKCSIIVTNCKCFHSLTQGMTSAESGALHSDMLTKFLGNCAMSKGCIDTFSGDRILASFNAVKPVSTHRSAVCTYASQCRQVFKVDDLITTHSFTKKGDGFSNAISGPQKPTRLDLSAGVCTGDMLCGNMGCQGLKKFAIISPVVTFTYALERHANVQNARIVVDEKVHGEARTAFGTRLLGTMLMEKRAAKPINVHELMEARGGAGEEEWMYQLEEMDAKNVFADWDTAVDCFIAGHTEKGCQLFKELSPEATQGHCGTKFQDAAMAGTPPENLQVVVTYH